MILGRDPNGPLIRNCHSRIGDTCCPFSWPEADDWKYTLVDGAKLDVHEFEAVMARIRRTPEIGIPIGGMGPPFDRVV
jgi:hypothetical protein